MATNCKNKYEIRRRYWAYKRLCRMGESYCDVPPIEIYGLNTKLTGLFTLDDVCNLLAK